MPGNSPPIRASPASKSQRRSFIPPLTEIPRNDQQIYKKYPFYNQVDAKFVAIKHVIDPGTLQERTYVYPVSDDLWIGVIEGTPGVWPGTVSIAKSLSVGDHVVEVNWIFSAMHCDGFRDSVELFCCLD